MAKGNFRRRTDIWTDDAREAIEKQHQRWQKRRKQRRQKEVQDSIKQSIDAYLDPFFIYAATAGFYAQKTAEIYSRYADDAFKGAAIGIALAATGIGIARLLMYPAGLLHRRAQQNEQADAASWLKTIALLGLSIYTLQAGYEQIKKITDKPEVPALTTEETESLVDKVLEHQYQKTNYGTLIAQATEDPTAQANIATIVALEVGNEKNFEKATSATNAQGPGQFTRTTAVEVELCSKATDKKSACAAWDYRNDPTKVLPAIDLNLTIERDRISKCKRDSQELEERTLDLLAIGAHNAGSALICEALKEVGDKPTVEDVQKEITPKKVRKVYSKTTIQAIQAGYKRANKQEKRDGDDIKAAEVRRYIAKAEQLQKEFLEALE